MKINQRYEILKENLPPVPREGKNLECPMGTFSKKIDDLLSGKVTEGSMVLEKLLLELLSVVKNVYHLDGLNQKNETSLGEIFFLLKNGKTKMKGDDHESMFSLLSIEFFKFKHVFEKDKAYFENQELFNTLFKKISMICIFYLDNLYLGFHFLKKSEDMEYISDFIDANFELLKADYDFGQLVNRHSTDKDKKLEVSRQYFNKNKKSYVLCGPERDFDHLKDILDQLKIKIIRYSTECKIPHKQDFDSLILNQAMEMRKIDFDLMIGVVKSGSNVPIINEMLGGDSAYIEWHKDWKRKPKVLRCGKSRGKIDFSKYKNILICEHDTMTGQTLEKIKDFLITRGVKEASIVFRSDHHRTNRMIANNYFFKNVINHSEVPNDELIENMLLLEDAFRSI